MAYQTPAALRNASPLQNAMAQLGTNVKNFSSLPSITQYQMARDFMGNSGLSGNVSASGAGGGDVNNPYLDQANAFAQGLGTPSTADNRFLTGLSSAESRLSSLLDNPDSTKETAAYKFRVGQGQQALERSLAAKGMLGSGNRLMELTKYGQDMGSQEYENQFGRLSNLTGQLQQGYLGQEGINNQRYLGELETKQNLLSSLISGYNTARGQQLNADLGQRRLDLEQTQSNPLGTIGGIGFRTIGY